MSKKISQLNAASALDGTEMIELVQGGASVRSTVSAVKNGVVKVYRALLSQSGTDAPVATVLENTLGGEIVWDRVAQGYYTGTLAGAFPPDKTQIFASANQVIFLSMGLDNPPSPDVIFIQTNDQNGALQDNRLQNASIKITADP